MGTRVGPGIAEEEQAHRDESCGEASDDTADHVPSLEPVPSADGAESRHVEKPTAARLGEERLTATLITAPRSSR